MAGLRAIFDRCTLNAVWVKMSNRSYLFTHDRRTFEGGGRAPGRRLLDQYETETDADMRPEPAVFLLIYSWRIEDGQERARRRANQAQNVQGHQ